MKELLPYLFILICPLMMLFMMRVVHGRSAHAADQYPAASQRSILDACEGGEVATLREQRDQLETRVQELETQMSRLERSRKAEPRVSTLV